MRWCKGAIGLHWPYFFLEESIFYLNEVINRHNYRFRIPENLHWICAYTRRHHKVTVFSVISHNRIIEQYVFELELYIRTLLRLLKHWISWCYNCSVPQPNRFRYSHWNILVSTKWRSLTFCLAGAWTDLVSCLHSYVTDM